MGIEPAEFHGILCGMVCNRIRPGSVEWKGAMFPILPLEQLVEGTEGLDIAMYRPTLEALKSTDLGLELFIPHEDEAISIRFKGLSSWCGGFISGYSYGKNRAPTKWDDDIKEVLEDFSSISRIRDTVGESEENESDFVQLEEYVRMAVVMVFTELNRNE